MIQKEIRDGIKEAMLKKDTLRLSVLRGLQAGFMNELIAKKKSPQDEMSDEDALAVIRRGVKQRKDSVEQFKGGGREDLAKNEEAEMAILETFLPKMMSREDIKKTVLKIKEKLGVSDKSKMGMFVGAVMKELKGKADGTDVKAVVEEVLG